MDLIDRKYRILQAIIDDYIQTALPVGSRTISKKYEQNLSSATIRNEMSDLEELGYLDSPHTSAGRIPSLKAYRLYVDQMLHPSQLTPEERRYLQECFTRRMHQVETLSARLARAISGMTSYTTAVMTRSPRSEQKLSHIQLVPISERMALLILVTQRGTVREQILDMDQPIDPEALYTVSRVLSSRLAGCPMDKLPEALGQITKTEPDEVARLLRAIELAPEDPQESTIVVGGRSNILGFPEYSDVGKAQELLRVLETQDKLASLLSRQGEMEINVRIGPENGVEELRDCSVVTMSYRLRDGRVNTIGLIGPTRMQYGKAVAVLGEVGRVLSQMLRQEIDEEEPD